jgi:CHAD domain
MKARKVDGLDPEGTLADNVERIIAVRLDELVSFMPKAADPGKVKALHDLRIAAKRLRYLLEMFSPCFGPYAATAAKRAKRLQDLVGEIHDCDVMLPRIEGLIDELRERDALEVRALAGDAEDVAPELTAHAPHAKAFRGLESLAVHVRARRLLLFERFLELWTELQREGFAARLRFAVTERAQPEPEPEPEAEPQAPASTSRSHDGNGHRGPAPLPSGEPAA